MSRHDTTIQFYHDAMLEQAACRKELQTTLDAVRKECESVKGTYHRLSDLEDAVSDAFIRICKLVGVK